jgi:hypothetical protein
MFTWHLQQGDITVARIPVQMVFIPHAGPFSLDIEDCDSNDSASGDSGCGSGGCSGAASNPARLAGLSADPSSHATVLSASCRAAIAAGAGVGTSVGAGVDGGAGAGEGVKATEWCSVRECEADVMDAVAAVAGVAALTDAIITQRTLGPTVRTPCAVLDTLRCTALYYTTLHCLPLCQRTLHCY